MITILNELNKRGELKRLVQAGLMSTKVLLYYNIYLQVDKMKRTTKICMTDIVSRTSEQFQVSEKTIYLAYKKLKNYE